MSSTDSAERWELLRADSILHSKNSQSASRAVCLQTLRGSAFVSIQNGAGRGLLWSQGVADSRASRSVVQLIK